VNRAPVLNAVGDQAVDEGSPLNISLSGSDVDADAIGFSADLSGLPATASFDVDTASMSWTPTIDEAGVYSVTFSVEDIWGSTDSETISVTVNNFSVPQSIISRPVTDATTAMSYQYQLQSTLPAQYMFVQKPAGMTLSGSVITWMPAFKQGVNDPGTGASNSYTVEVAVAQPGAELVPDPNVPTQTFTVTVELLGDLNDNGVIDAGDVILAERILSGSAVPSQQQSHRLDLAPLVQGKPAPDGVLNVADLLVLQRINFSINDTDNDGVIESLDNCTVVANPDQWDTDSDGIGNRCDCDFNNDNFCGGPDFTSFISCFNSAVNGNATCAAADMNGDDYVGGPDFTLFIGGFNGPPGPAADPLY
jgi:hypothetical protein